MKKTRIFLTVGLMVAGLFLAGFLISTNAQATAGNASSPLFSTFEIPTRPYGTAAETKIPVDEIYAVIDNLDIIDFPDGKVRIKSIGEDTFKYVNDSGRSRADHNTEDFFLPEPFRPPQAPLWCLPARSFRWPGSFGWQ